MNLNRELIDFIKSNNQNESECLIYLFACKYGLQARCSEECFRFLQANDLIYLDFTSNKIKSKVGLFEGEIVSLPEYNKSIEYEIRSRIDEYRHLFKGIRPQSIGIKSKVIDLMIRFCLSHDKTLDEVIAVTENYLANGDKYLSNADNFIYKLDKDGSEISLLELAFEEYEMQDKPNHRLI